MLRTEHSILCSRKGLDILIIHVLKIPTWNWWLPPLCCSLSFLVLFTSSSLWYFKDIASPWIFRWCFSRNFILPLYVKVILFSNLLLPALLTCLDLFVIFFCPYWVCVTFHFLPALSIFHGQLSIERISYYFLCFTSHAIYRSIFPHNKIFLTVKFLSALGGLPISSSKWAVSRCKQQSSIWHSPDNISQHISFFLRFWKGQQFLKKNIRSKKSVRFFLPDLSPCHDTIVLC